MLASVVFVPSAPLLVPQLAGPAAADTGPVRAAVIDAGARLARTAPRWVAIGAGDDPFGVGGGGAADGGVAGTGTFARFGVDVPVALDTGGTPHAPAGAARMPLSMLVAGWLRGIVGAGPVRPLVIDPGASPEACARTGRGLAADLAGDADPVGVLVVADGATALSPKAPGGGLRDHAVTLQWRIDAALGAADLTALAALDPDACRDAGVGGRPAWQVAAALVAASPCDGEPGRAPHVDVGYAGAPFGVGYTVATWTP